MGEVALTRSARFSGGVGKILLTIFFLLVFLNRATAHQQSANNSKNTVPPSGQISGHVYGADAGGPLAKAVVTLEGQSEGNLPTSESVETAADGVFRFTGLKAGKYLISIERCGYISEPHIEYGATLSDSLNSVSLTAGEKRDGVDFRLARGGVISGSVTDEDNEPVPGLVVQAMPFPYEPGGNHLSYAIATATTDDLGNFRLIGLNPGSYYVYVTSAGQRWFRRRNVGYRDVFYPQADSPQDAQRVRVDFAGETSGIHVGVRLARSFSVHGHVQGSCSGVPEITCMLLAFRTNSAITNPSANSAVDENGSFEVPGLIPGEYEVKAIAIRQPNGEMTQRLSGTGSTRVQIFDRDAEAEVSVGPLAQISGTVIDESSKPIQLRGVKIAVRQIGSAEGQGRDARMFFGENAEGRPVDAKGRFEVNGIEAGTYVLDLEGAEGLQVDDPAQQANASAVDDPGAMYVKEFVCAGHDYAARSFEISTSTRLSDCKIKISHDPASMSGRVLNGDKGVAGQIVVAIPESPELRRNPRYTLSGRTNREGQFNINGIIPGDYLIFAVTPNIEQSYYALDFAERNPRDAERATFKPGEAKTFVLKPSTAQ